LPEFDSIFERYHIPISHTHISLQNMVQTTDIMLQWHRFGYDFWRDINAMDYASITRVSVTEEPDKPACC